MTKQKSKDPNGGARGRILMAAAEEFAQRGFDGARVDQIARRAGVNKAMLYYHVGDKTALYEQVLTEAVAEASVRIREGVLGRETPEGKVLAIAQAFEDLARAKPHMPRIMLREMAAEGRNLPAPVLKLLAGIILIEKTILDGAARSGRFRSANPLSVHVLLVGGIMLHLAARSLRERMDGRARGSFPEPTRYPAETVSDLLLHGLVRPGEGKPGDGAAKRASRRVLRRQSRMKEECS